MDFLATSRMTTAPSVNIFSCKSKNRWERRGRDEGETSERQGREGERMIRGVKRDGRGSGGESLN